MSRRRGTSRIAQALAVLTVIGLLGTRWWIVVAALAALLVAVVCVQVHRAYH